MENSELRFKKQYLMKLFFTTMLTISFIGLQAQNGIGFFGNTQIHSGGELHVENYEVYNQGETKTHRDNPIGVVSVNQSTNGNANPEGFIDGYIRAYQSGDYQFQVGGSAVYAPISINLQKNDALDVAYNRESYHPEETHQSIDAVSAIEYWDVLGENSGKLTLFWKAESELNDLLDDISDLTIAGWNGSEWEIIASTTVNASTLESGSIESNNVENFSVYSAFTFGKMGNLSTEEFELQHVAITLQKGFLYIHSDKEIENVELFDVTGRHIRTYNEIDTLRFQADFPYPKGVYIAKAFLQNGNIFTKKLMHK